MVNKTGSRVSRVFFDFFYMSLWSCDCSERDVENELPDLCDQLIYHWPVTILDSWGNSSQFRFHLLHGNFDF